MVGKKKGLAADVKAADDLFKWKALLERPSVSPPQVKLDFNDVAMYQYTGGTTGVSKGVMLTHGNLSKQIQQVSGWFPSFGSDEIMLGALPFFHVFGLTTAMNFAIFKGWGNILVPKPQPPQLLEAIGKFKPTFAPLVPTMYIGMLEHPDIGKTDLTSIKGCFSGSAPLPVEVISAFEAKTGAVIVEGFGMTESSPVTHINPFKGKRKVGSVGIPLSDTECRIVALNDAITDVAVGETGELLVKGPQVMKGYWNRPDTTAETITDGWLHTGDIAKMDEEGYFYIVDRKKDMIISGGFNVYPRDIEEVFFEHPKVVEATAIGIPHPKRGEAIKVFVVLKEGQTATVEELLKYCEDKLAKYKWPAEIEFRQELPKTSVGKVLKKSCAPWSSKKPSRPGNRRCNGDRLHLSLNRRGMLWLVFYHGRPFPSKYLPYKLSDILFGQRLHRKTLNPKEPRLAFRDEVAVTSAENDRQPGPNLQHSPCHINAGHARHCLISDDQVELIRLFLEGVQSLKAVSSDGHMVTEALQHYFAHFCQDLFIINKKNPFIDKLRKIWMCRLYFEQCWVSNNRQKHMNNCPVTEHAVPAHKALTTLDYTMDDG